MSGSTLYERNLFYQQLNFKFVFSKYLQHLLWKLKSNERCRGRLFVVTLSFLLIYLIDFMMGALLLLVLMQNPQLKQQLLEALSTYTRSSLDWTHSYLAWLSMGVPWGIKLNTPLNQFLGTRFLYILTLWRSFYSEFIAVYLSAIVDFLLLLLPFGITLSLTALHDFLKFLNLCLICFFVISNRIFVLQVSALKSLGRLFLGKKWNVLRQRVDSYDHAGSPNQLLVGTMLFTVLLFLLPTTGMYTLIFLCLRLVQFLVQLGLRAPAVLLNKASAFALSSLHRSLQDQPLTEARVLIAGLTPDRYASLRGKEGACPPRRVVEGKWCTLECFDVDEGEVSIEWNGREYSVEEMREILDNTSEEVLYRDLELTLGSDGGGGCGQGVANSAASQEGVVRSHSMMHWFWTFPKN